MFFRHQKMDEDLKYHPEWTPYCPKYGSSTGSESAHQPCPYKELLETVGLY